MCSDLRATSDDGKVGGDWEEGTEEREPGQKVMGVQTRSKDMGRKVSQ